VIAVAIRCILITEKRRIHQPRRRLRQAQNGAHEAPFGAFILRAILGELKRMPLQQNWRRLRATLHRETKMEFTALFAAVTVVMLVAWRGSRSLALALYAGVLIAAVATYLHHATDPLKLSF
jgi:hypothetical protein